MNLEHLFATYRDQLNEHFELAFLYFFFTISSYHLDYMNFDISRVEYIHISIFPLHKHT